MSKIKICGLTRTEDIDFVNRALPDYIGFVFAPSKRQISFEQAATLKSLLSKEMKAVGVFVDMEIDLIQQLCANRIIDLVQLHGDQDEHDVRQLKKVISVPVIKAVRMGNRPVDVTTTADYLLFDTYHKEQYGGTGARFNWSLIHDCCDLKKPFFLSGGIHLDNVQQAIETVDPYCVDLSSGVETNGTKDKQKIVEMITRVRSMKQYE